MATTGTTLILGAGGMLGRELARAAAARCLDSELRRTADEADITDADAIASLFDECRPTTVINAAAWTDVDGAEEAEENAARVNHHGPAILARCARAHRALLVHYSTDYIFDGRGVTPYRADAPVAPASAYGRTKLAGERAIRESGCEHLIIRTSWLFAPHSANFVRTILRLANDRDTISVVDDQRGRPTYAPDLAAATFSLIDADARNVYHVTNDGECSWYEFARAIVELAGLNCDVQPCTTEAFPRPAPRPPYSVLEIESTKDAIGPVRHWREALAECLNEMKPDSGS